ncbi:ankyrin repeat-containing protein [Apiospora saccharicola]
MEGNKRSGKDLKWESFRVDIERMFGKERRSLEEIKTWLENQGFHATKNQLHYRLNKIWGLRSRAPRGHAQKFWRAARLLQTPETAESGPRFGSFVLDNRQRLKPRDPARQIKRYNIETHSSSYRSIQIQQADNSPQANIRMATPERVEAPFLWPRDLPWLVSSVQNLRITSGHPEGLPDSNVALRLEIFDVLGIPFHSPTNKWWRVQFISHIASGIPELEAGDAKKRAQVMLSDRSDNALSEQVKVLLQKVSNNFLGTNYMDDRFPGRIGFVLDLVEQSGLWKKTLDLNGNDSTMKAAGDALFQGTFLFLSQIEFRKDKLRYDTRRAYMVLRWLLRSGQDPNIPIMLNLGMITTGPQISLELGIGDLAMELMACQTNPVEFNYSKALYATEAMNKCFLHPIFLAMSRPGPTLAILEHRGFSLHGHTDLTPYRIDSYGNPWRTREISKLNPIPYTFLTQGSQFTTAVVQYLLDHADENGENMYRRVVDWNAVFLYASGAGDLDVLKLLIMRHHDFRGSDYTTITDFINMPNEWGITALQAAVLARRKSLETCQFLLNQGAILDDSSELLHLACCFHALEMVKFLHRRGMDIHRRCKDRSHMLDSCTPHCLDPSKKTPLELVLQLMSSLRHRLKISTELVMVCEYLIDNGSDITWEVLDTAIATTNAELLSAALKSATDVISRYRTVFRRSPLSKTLELIRFGNKAEVGRISHLLLDAGAEVETGDAVRAAFLDDWNLVTKILDTGSKDISESISRFKEPDSMDGVTLLEAALLSGSCDVANKALELEPEQYDIGALCAASLMSSNTGNYTIVRALIDNRPRRKHVYQKQKYTEMTAIGIAAYKGDYELFDLLRRHLPWSKQAIVPCTADVASAFELDPLVSRTIRDGRVLKNRPLIRRFWHTGLTGSIQVFGVATESKMFDLFFNPGYPICSMALHLLVQRKLYDQIATLSRRGYRAEHISSYAAMVSPLHTAVWERDTSLVLACLDLGLDINGFERDQKCLSGIEDQTKTCLTRSIQQEDLEIANLLLDKGADVNSPPHPDYGMTPLQAACTRGHIGIVMRLLRLGADPNAPGASYYGRTALEGAAEHGRLDIVHLLLRAGVKTEGFWRRQYIRATFLARRECHIQVQKLLESYREWSEEDRSLWNDPDLPYHDTEWSSSIDGSEPEDEEGEEEEAESDETENSDSTPDLGQRNDISVVYDDPADEPATFGDLGPLLATTDPFVGYERTDEAFNMMGPRTWDDLDYI